MSEDSFERAREAFFGAGKIAPCPNALRAEFLKQEATNRAREAPTSGANDYCGVLFSSSREIRLLKDAARRLSERGEAMLDPEFFLNSIFDGWAPRVVAVYKGCDVAGMMFARERIISGVPTGVVYADGALGGFLLVSQMHQRSAFRVALKTLLSSPKIRSL